MNHPSSVAQLPTQSASRPRTENSFAVPLYKRIGYDGLRVFSRLFGVAFCRLRTFGREHGPASGPALICSNHQSYIDPVLVGLAFDRRLNYLARKTLFRFKPFRLLIEYFDALPVDQDGSGLGGVKEAMKRLRRGEMVLIFPEGSRTTDGEIGPMMPGFSVLARRCSVPLVPVGIEGAFQFWPIDGYPKLHPLCVVVGPPILPSEVATMDDDELMAELDRRIRACHARARTALNSQLWPPQPGA